MGFQRLNSEVGCRSREGEHGVPRPSLPHTSLPCSLSSSVQFSRSVVSDSLRPHESQHARPPCPSPTHGVYSNSCPSSRWRHPDILSSVIPFSSCPQSLPASGSFPMSQLFLLSPSSFLTTCYKLICDVHLWQAPPLNQNEFFIRAGACLSSLGCLFQTLAIIWFIAGV